MRYNREETKSFNAKEKVRIMVRERKRLLLRENNMCKFGRHYNKEKRESNG
jgi:hypothetical protein